MNKRKFLLVIAGPTASGKTEVAIKIAGHFKTEIISADSRQFYREMTVGTAVPDQSQLLQAKHHFIQNRSINEPYDVATYEKEVLELLDKLFVQHQVVILTGGSGLFINAVCLGLDDMPETDAAIREQVQQLHKQKGLKGLQQELQKLDPDYYNQVDKLNPRRLQRALEVCYQTGKPYSSFRRRSPENRPFEVLWTALRLDRLELVNRINIRVEKMMAAGLLDEARRLYPLRQNNALNTVGYKELFSYIGRSCDLEHAVEQIKGNTRQYAKRQMTWFRKNDNYKWFSPDNIQGLIAYIEKRMNEAL